MRESFIKIICLLIIIGLNWTGLSAIGQTFAYFSDTESSLSTSLQTGVLDMTVRSGQNNFTPNAENMMHGDQVNRDIYVGKTAVSLPLKHRVSYEFVDGNEGLCNQLDLKIWYDHYHGPVSGGYDNRDMRLTYDGKLSVLMNYAHSDFEIPHPDDWFDKDPTNGTEQWFYYSIILPSSIPDSFQGEVCKFNFVFEGWQDNVDNYGDGGFSDVERIENTIKVGYWNPPVVLNEFLPNAGNYPEFIEIYNKTNGSIDLQQYKVEVSRGKIPIIPQFTSMFSGGSTVISPNGWLVVAPLNTNQPVTDMMNNNGGTVTLYNPNDVVVDSYNYGDPDHNINNTPGWTNNLVGYWPFDDDAQDLSGNTNNGINNGAIFVDGKINKALSFDGVDDYVTIANSDDFDFGSGEFSVEFWTKTDSSSRQWVGTRYENYGPGWGLGTQNNHTLGYIRTLESGTGKKEIEGTVDVSNNDWHHLIMVRIGDKIKIYTDGNFEKEGTLAGDVNNDEPVEIGRISWSGGSQYFKGFIDEVKIYNRALDDAEILEHYNDVDSLDGAVPVDKSYARIPDGIGSWVDPFPTPGGPNTINNESVEIIIPEVNEEITNDKALLVGEGLASESIDTGTSTPEEELIIIDDLFLASPNVAFLDFQPEEGSVTEEEIASTTDEVITAEAMATEATTDVATTEEEITTTTEEMITTEPVTGTSGETTEDVIEDEDVIEVVVEEVADEPIVNEIEEEAVEEMPIIEETPIVEEPVIEEPIVEEAPIDEVIDETIIDVVEEPEPEQIEETPVEVVDETPVDETPADEIPTDEIYE